MRIEIGWILPALRRLRGGRRGESVSHCPSALLPVSRAAEHQFTLVRMITIKRWPQSFPRVWARPLPRDRESTRAIYNFLDHCAHPLHLARRQGAAGGQRGVGAFEPIPIDNAAIVRL